MNMDNNFIKNKILNALASYPKAIPVGAALAVGASNQTQEILL